MVKGHARAAEHTRRGGSILDIGSVVVSLPGVPKIQHVEHLRLPPGGQQLAVREGSQGSFGEGVNGEALVVDLWEGDFKQVFQD